MSKAVNPVDEVLPAPKLAALGLQHVLVMYAGAVAVPLIIGRALQLTPEQIAFLINADLFACGIVTLIQAFGIPGVGIRLPEHWGRRVEDVEIAEVRSVLHKLHAVGEDALGFD